MCERKEGAEGLRELTATLVCAAMPSKSMVLSSSRTNLISEMPSKVLDTKISNSRYCEAGSDGWKFRPSQGCVQDC